jgi:glycosyltransferase involved in cell wall biosynthesis
LTNQEKIQIIIQSRLHSYDGGRETWLNNFLLEYYEQDSQQRFQIVAFKDVDSVSNDYLKALKLPSVELLMIELGDSWFTKNSVLKKLKFFIFTSLLRMKHKGLTLYIGSFWEVGALICSKILLPISKKENIIWLRTVFKKEISQYHKGLLKNIFVLWELIAIKLSSRIIANGYDTAEAYVKYSPVVIPNAIPLDSFLKIQTSNRKPATKKRILFLGRLSEVKGFDAFASSIELYNQSFPTELVEFQIIGWGEGEKKANILAETHTNVKYIGKIENTEVPSVLELVDVVVALTFAMDHLGGGGVSNALIEQMAAGKMIIAWDNKIFRKVLSEESAILVKENCVKDLAASFLNSSKMNKNDYLNFCLKVKDLALNYSIQDHVHNFRKEIVGKL